MSVDSIRAEAHEAFMERDRLEAELREVNSRLGKLKSQYMIETHVWGLRDERFRQEAKAKVAA